MKSKTYTILVWIAQLAILCGSFLAGGKKGLGVALICEGIVFMIGIALIQRDQDQKK